jgi:hypothetical protein
VSYSDLKFIPDYVGIIHYLKAYQHIHARSTSAQRQAYGQDDRSSIPGKWIQFSPRHHFQPGSRKHPPSIQRVPGLFPRGSGGQGAKLTNNFHPVPRLRIRKCTPPPIRPWASCFVKQGTTLSRVYTMQIGSRESSTEDARADVSCKLWKVRQVGVCSTCTKRKRASPALDSRQQTFIV